MNHISDRPTGSGHIVSRRRFIQGLSQGLAAGVATRVTAAGVAAAAAVPVAATAASAVELTGTHFELTVGYVPVNFSGRPRQATAINGSVPAPLLRWREGDTVTLNVRNQLDHDTSIHWHGLILPASMDGVPGLSEGFNGIKPGSTFQYRFPVQQSGTYWYHSHSGFQEQTGLYGPIIIEPRAPEPFAYDRDYVVLLSDWSDEDPQAVYANLKKLSHVYAAHERTLGDLWQELQSAGVSQTWQQRAMWNQMRMSDRDIADVTGLTYTFLLNGCPPAQGWEGLFAPGETLRLRLINAGAMTFFDVRIPGLQMTVVAADGQYIEPVTVDEIRIGNAETYDVLVTPVGARPYTLFAQAMDRSGYARGTLTPQAGLAGLVPPMDPPPVLSHTDMGMAMDAADHAGHGATPAAASTGPHQEHAGMAHAEMGHAEMGHAGMAHTEMGHRGMDHHAEMGHAEMGHAEMAHTEMGHRGMDHSGMSSAGRDHRGMDHNGMDHRAHAPVSAPVLAMGAGPAGYGSARPVAHAASERGPQVDMLAPAPQYRLDDPGVGLRANGRRVLTYADLRHRYHTPDPRQPSREIDLHLTGNMSRYMWSINGVAFADAEPIHLRLGERVRFNLINDTMMNHPIHLHGLWSDLETGDPHRIPRKHTVIVQPGARISYLVSADTPGAWAYHCHLMYHMLSMFRTVVVDGDSAAGAPVSGGSDDAA